MKIKYDSILVCVRCQRFQCMQIYNLNNSSLRTTSFTIILQIQGLKLELYILQYVVPIPISHDLATLLLETSYLSHCCQARYPPDRYGDT